MTGDERVSRKESGVLPSLKTERYAQQASRWPRSGRFILAQHDDDSIIVYQAYRAEIGLFAATHGWFGGAFSLNRMSWIKTSFMWMMYRSDWGRREGQEITLAIRLQRDAFNRILSSAVHSSFDPMRYPSLEEWKRRGRETDVRLQWDPDHGPDGAPMPRKAIQLGLRGETLRRYSKDWILDVYDISEFVAEQRLNRFRAEQLTSPEETVFVVDDPITADQIGISSPE